MAGFMVRFAVCNILLCCIIGILLLLKHMLKNSLSSQMQYNLWFLLLGLLAVPFLPFRLFGFPQILSWFGRMSLSPVSKTGTVIGGTADTLPISGKNWMEDSALSANVKTPPMIGYLLLAVWSLGIIAMLLSAARSALRLHTLEKSALPLQNPGVRRLYKRCLSETGITKNIPVYSTAFLKSPVIAGILRPRIYLPIHLISDNNETDIRYMLLHELMHYKHKDGIANCLMNLAGVLYWFNPLVRHALREMRNDREIACDTSVLNILEPADYIAYGNTLISFAEKISLAPLPFASGISGNKKQIQRRILNIASYERPTLLKKLKSTAVFLLTSVLLFGLAPFVSTCAADEDHYQWNAPSQNFSDIDLTGYFGEYKGSFVLYDLKNNTWKIHDMERAALRVSPDSTYKIYDALFGLKNGIITLEDSLMEWNGNTYPFEAWNADQTLASAMRSSVNWYFQSIDERLGTAALKEHLHEIGYGNEDLSGGLSSYWMESSLKISPLEQVGLLTKLQEGSLGFSPEHTAAVKDSLRISSSNAGSLYGKTGTGRINGQDVNGWFIGFVEKEDNTYVFAANIHAKEHAGGSAAAKITLSVLSDLNIWEQ